MIGTPDCGASVDLRVEMRLLGQYAEMAGSRRLMLTLPRGGTLGEALRALEVKLPGTAKCRASGCEASMSNAVIFINGRNAAHDGGPDRKLADGDCIIVTTPVGGG